jgi:uncharacterized protein YdhG (YjbR/CyaY superfamily)
MKIESSSPENYIAQLPADRQSVIAQLRKTINENIPEGFQEMIIYDMIGWVVPKSIYPNGYHCNTDLPLPFMNIASQKHFVALYHMGLYADTQLLDWFVGEYPKNGKSKLDMGKSCIRFKKMDDIPYGLIAQLVGKMNTERWISLYELALKR